MKTILSLFILLIAFQPAARAERQLVDRVVAVVNNDAITQSELDSILGALYRDYKDQFQGQEFMAKINEARQKLLNQLIEDRLVFQEAEKRKVTVDQVEIQEQLDEFKNKFKTEQELDDALKTEGITKGMLEDKIRRQLMIRKLHDQEVRSHVVVSPAEVEEYYDKHPDQFSSEEAIKIRSLTIKKSELARQKGLLDEAAQKLILDLRERIQKGESFTDLAKEFSQDSRAADGGLSDWVTKGSMIDAVDEVIFAHKVGELSEMVETPVGYHLFKIEEKKEGHKQTFEEAREEIQYNLYRQKADARFEEWMNQLKRTAYISIR